MQHFDLLDHASQHSVTNVCLISRSHYLPRHTGWGEANSSPPLSTEWQIFIEGGRGSAGGANYRSIFVQSTHELQVQKLCILIKASFVLDKEKHTSTITVTKMREAPQRGKLAISLLFSASPRHLVIPKLIISLIHT